MLNSALIQPFFDAVHFFSAGHVCLDQILAAFFDLTQSTFKRPDPFTQTGTNFWKFFAAEYQKGNTKYY